MGYYINTTSEQDFLLPKENFDAAYKAMCELNKHDDLKRGGTGAFGSEDRQVWFSWMHENYPEVCEDLFEIFDHLGFDYTKDGDGNIDSLSYDNKQGAEEVFLAAIAPFVKDGSFMTWRGEDGELWRYLYRDGRLKTVPAVITFPEHLADEPTFMRFMGTGYDYININERLFGDVVNS